MSIMRVGILSVLFVTSAFAAERPATADAAPALAIGPHAVEHSEVVTQDKETPWTASFASYKSARTFATARRRQGFHVLLSNSESRWLVKYWDEPRWASFRTKKSAKVFARKMMWKGYGTKTSVQEGQWVVKYWHMRR